MSAQILLAVGAGAMALAVTVLVLTLAMGSAQPTGVARSLAVIDQMSTRRDVARQELPFTERILFPVLKGTRSLGERLSPAGTAGRLQKNLDFAGNPAAWTVERILGLKGAALLVGALLGAVFGGLGIKGLLFAALGAAVGFWLPDLLVYNVGLKRQLAIRRSLADALDMLTVCVEAGLGFDSAMMHVARNVDGPLAGEFARVLQEVQIGKSRREAFEALAARTNVDELNTFVSALSQADRMGIPIANVLREQSKEMRLIRRQRAEEQAQKVTVKIVFPVLLCIFPSIFVVILGPAAMNIAKLFIGMG